MWSHPLPSDDLFCSGNWNVALTFATRRLQAFSFPSFSNGLDRSPGSRLSHPANPLVSIPMCMVFTDIRSTLERALKHWSRRLHASHSCNTRTRPRCVFRHHMPSHWDIVPPPWRQLMSYTVLYCTHASSRHIQLGPSLQWANGVFDQVQKMSPACWCPHTLSVQI